MSLVYEVNLSVRRDIEADYRAWLDAHVREILALPGFTGATVAYADPGREPVCVEDIDAVTQSYVRWPESVRQLMKAPIAARYLPDRHVFTSPSLGLELAGTPLVPVPAHALPVEYMEGPFHFVGTMHGQPVQGFGISEKTMPIGAKSYRARKRRSERRTSGASDRSSRLRPSFLSAMRPTYMLVQDCR